MPLAADGLWKQPRKLRKSLKKLLEDSSAARVHQLRTRTRRMEAMVYVNCYREKIPTRACGTRLLAARDPSVFTVFLEDSASLLGTALAFLGIFLGHMLHNPSLDPSASILIGILLGAVAVLLGRESGALL